MTRPDPYTELAKNWPNVRIRIKADLGKDAGRTVWSPTGAEIHLAHDLHRAQRRCVLAHEIQHLERGPENAGTTEDEDAVIAATARWLIPDIERFGFVLRELDVIDAAAEFDVVPSVIYDRLDHLGKYELQHLTAAMNVARVRLAG